MTLPLPRKPRTTVRGRTTPGRTRASLAAALVLFLGSMAVGRQPIVSQPVAAESPDAIRPVRYQKAPDEAKGDYQVEVIPPGKDRLSQFDSDAKLQERIRQETIERTGKDVVPFPEEPILSREVYKGRVGLWPVRQMVVEPNFVNYKKLYFQQINTDRYGWDLGPITPLVCTAKFYFDLATVPLQFGAHPCERESSAGYCLPGDPVPLLLYPPEITITGLTLEAAAVMALVAVFP